MTFTPRLVALDIDGTLVDADGRMPDEIHAAVRRVVDAVQLGECGVVQYHPQLVVEQHDGFTHGLQHCACAGTGLAEAKLDIGTATDLPLQQPQHQPQQQQHQRGTDTRRNKLHIENRT